jgi:hypothetical protein
MIREIAAQRAQENVDVTYVTASCVLRSAGRNAQRVFCDQRWAVGRIATTSPHRYLRYFGMNLSRFGGSFITGISSGRSG